MTVRVVLASAAAALVMCAPGHAARASQSERTVGPTESLIPVRGASLYSRVVGQGQPVIVLHGGPDFDHRYLLPDMDQFRDVLRLIYYDQRGRGKSANEVRPEDVTITSEVEDLDKVRQRFGLGAAALLGHSWGAVLALEYALRHPDRVSHLLLMNPAPVSASDVSLLRETYGKKLGSAMDRQREILSSAAYQAGDPEAVAARYRIHFKTALKRAGDYERLIVAMTAAFKSQGREGIVRARAVEAALMRNTWQVPGYDLLQKLRSLRIPTLVIAGEDDFIPVTIADHIATAIPGARLVTIKECGHFAYLECGGAVRIVFENFFVPERRGNAVRSQSGWVDCRPHQHR
jgi:proline iminopeptidase